MSDAPAAMALSAEIALLQAASKADAAPLYWRQRNTFLEFFGDSDSESEAAPIKRFGSRFRSRSLTSVASTAASSRCGVAGSGFLTTPMSSKVGSTGPNSPRSSVDGSSTAAAIEASETASNSGSTSESVATSTVSTASGTTVMLKNIACRFSQEEVAEILNERGLRGTYDFVYLPRSPARQSNLGYAFVNFNSAELMLQAASILDNEPFGLGRSLTEKRCQVVPAHVQGHLSCGQRGRRRGAKRPQAEPLYFDRDGNVVLPPRPEAPRAQAC